MSKFVAIFSANAVLFGVVMAAVASKVAGGLAFTSVLA